MFALPGDDDDDDDIFTCPSGLFSSQSSNLFADNDQVIFSGTDLRSIWCRNYFLCTACWMYGM